MIDRADMLAAGMRWAWAICSDIIAIGPAVLLGCTDPWGVRGSASFVYGNWVEKTAWGVLVRGGFAAIQWAVATAARIALGLATLPLALLLWSALRSSRCSHLLANAPSPARGDGRGTGLGGFTAPASITDVSVLIAFLCVIALTPQILSMAAHENRVAALRLLRRATTDA